MHKQRDFYPYVVYNSRPKFSNIDSQIESVMSFQQEVDKRRTFAIISHPDAAQPFNA